MKKIIITKRMLPAYRIGKNTIVNGILHNIINVVKVAKNSYEVTLQSYNVHVPIVIFK